jgi:hypothetical protein
MNSTSKPKPKGPQRASAPGSQGPMVPVSFAKQEKSQDLRLYSRFQELNPVAVRVTRYAGGSTVEEILHDPDGSGQRWIDSVMAEKILYQIKAKARLLTLLARAPLRLKKKLGSAEEFEALPQEEKNILSMSQKDWNLFRDPDKGISGDQPTGSQDPGVGLQSPTQA